MKRLTLFASVLLIAACSTKPGEQLIEKLAAQQLASQHNSAIVEVINLHKVNGIKRDKNNYDAELEYDLRFRVDLKDATEQLQQQSGSIFAAGMETTTLGLSYGNFKAGETIHKREWFHFIKSEKGWLIEPGKP